jgi:hypothetical protein
MAVFVLLAQGFQSSEYPDDLETIILPDQDLIQVEQNMPERIAEKNSALEFIHFPTYLNPLGLSMGCKDPLI